MSRGPNHVLKGERQRGVAGGLVTSKELAGKCVGIEGAPLQMSRQLFRPNRNRLLDCLTSRCGRKEK
eukprot:415097-Rhodomonas_salina.1